MSRQLDIAARAHRNALQKQSRLAAANLIGLVALPLIDQLAWSDRAVIVVAMLLCVLIARACGALLPYLAELAITADAPAGWRSALLCVAYMAGAAAGAWMTGEVLIALALLPRWSPNVVEKIQAKAAADARPSIGMERDRTAANTQPQPR